MPQKYIDINGAYIEADVTLVTDSTGQYAFSPDSLAVAYGYDGNGVMISETRGPDLGGFSYKKTYGYDATTGRLNSETAWIKQ